MEWCVLPFLDACLTLIPIVPPESTIISYSEIFPLRCLAASPTGASTPNDTGSDLFPEPLPGDEQSFQQEVALRDNGTCVLTRMDLENCEATRLINKFNTPEVTHILIRDSP